MHRPALYLIPDSLEILPLASWAPTKPLLLFKAKKPCGGRGVGGVGVCVYEVCSLHLHVMVHVPQL